MLNVDLRMADEVQRVLYEKDNVNNVIPQVNISDVESCISHDNIGLTNEHLIYGYVVYYLPIQPS